MTAEQKAQLPPNCTAIESREYLSAATHVRGRFAVVKRGPAGREFFAVADFAGPGKPEWCGQGRKTGEEARAEADKLIAGAKRRWTGEWEAA